MIIATPRSYEKISTVAGQVPTVPASNDHTDKTWLTTDIYVGEFFLNVIDQKLYTRTTSGILQIYPQLSGSTYQDVYEYPDLASFPAIGDKDKLYMTVDTNLTYRWDTATSMYFQLASCLSGSTYWSTIVDHPNSYPAQIDAAVMESHSYSASNPSHYTKIESDGPATISGGTGAKVDKIIGKDLSTYDFDNYYRSLLTGYTDSVIEYVDSTAFPLSGATNTLYITTSDNKIWYWNSTLITYVDLFDTLPNWHAQNTDTGTTFSSFTISNLITLQPNLNTLEIRDTTGVGYGNLIVNDLDTLGELKIGNTGTTDTIFFIDNMYGTAAIKYVGGTGTTKNLLFTLDYTAFPITWTPLGFGTLLLDDLQDVTITAPAASDVLSYSSGIWVNRQESIGSVKYVPSGITYTIGTNFQNLVFGDLTVAGEIVNNGNITVLNGSVNLLGTGLISGPGLVEIHQLAYSGA